MRLAGRGRVPIAMGMASDVLGRIAIARAAARQRTLVIWAMATLVAAAAVVLGVYEGGVPEMMERLLPE